MMCVRIIDVKEGGEDGCKVSVVKPSHRSSGHSNRKEDDKDDVMQAMLSDIREVTTLTFLFYTYDKVHKFCFGVLRNQHISFVENDSVLLLVSRRSCWHLLREN